MARCSISPLASRWLLNVYEVVISDVETFERFMNTVNREWLGLPHCTVALYEKGITNDQLGEGVQMC